MFHKKRHVRQSYVDTGMKMVRTRFCCIIRHYCIFWNIFNIISFRKCLYNILHTYIRIQNPGGGEIFRTRPDWPWGLTSHLYNGYWVTFLGVKPLGRDVDHAPPSSAEIKEKVELYLYPRLDLRGVLQGELYLLYLITLYERNIFYLDNSYNFNLISAR